MRDIVFLITMTVFLVFLVNENFREKVLEAMMK